MPQIDLVDTMTKAPGRCGICNTTPTENGHPLPAIDTHVDVDWGNNFYICDECANVICDLMGRVTVKEHKTVKRDLRKLGDDHQRLRKRYERRERELEALAAGKKVEKRVRGRKAA